MDIPKISVIIPVYNVEQYLEQCLNSIITQSLKDIEIICIDDGSTDNSPKILADYQKKDERIKVITKKNEGQGIARNEGLKIAKGEYISFVDPDDWLEQGMYEFLYNKFIETNAQIIHFDFQSFNEKKQKIDSIKHFSKSVKKTLGVKVLNDSTYNWLNIPNLKFPEMELTVWCRMFSNKLLKENNIFFAPFKHSEDNIFVISSCILAEKMVYVEKVFYNYRKRENSALNRASKEYFSVFENIELVKNFLIENGFYEKYKNAYRKYLITTFVSHYGCIPDENSDEFLEKVQKILSKEEYKTFHKMTKRNFSFAEKLFALKNIRQSGKKRKVLNILGLTIVIK